jgi:decaprenylphospho-beta-D-ribofuranose 2-oxidase
LPLNNSREGLEEILHKISTSGRGSFLAVLKLYGPANDNYLSFPMQGYSLALDFAMDRGIFDFLDELDKLVLKYNGRIYLSKDVRVPREVFEQGYPDIDKFRAIRKEFDLNKKLNSLQSQRVGI